MKLKLLAPLTIVLVVLGLGRTIQSRGGVPKTYFEIKPRCINLADQTLIKFIDMSTDPHGDPLTHTWFIGGKLVNASRGHWGRLPIRSHSIQLVVSNGRTQSSHLVVQSTR